MEHVIPVPELVQSLTGNSVRGRFIPPPSIGQDTQYRWGELSSIGSQTDNHVPTISSSNSKMLNESRCSLCSTQMRGTSSNTTTSSCHSAPPAVSEEESGVRQTRRRQKRLTFHRVVRAVALLGDSRGSTLSSIRDVLTRDLGVTTLHGSLEGLQRQLEKGVQAGLLIQSQGEDLVDGRACSSKQPRFKLTTPRPLRKVYRYRVSRKGSKSS